MREMAECSTTHAAVPTGRAYPGANDNSFSFLCPHCRQRHYSSADLTWPRRDPRPANDR